MKKNLIYMNIGNSTITAGYFRGENFVLAGRWPAEPAAVKEINFNGAAVEKIVLASVVPEITGLLKRKYPGRVLEIKNKDVPVINLYKNKDRVGVDRLLTCLGAQKKYGRACLVVDFGTATTLNFISKRSEFKGGIIVPGAGLFAAYLFEKTSKLPKIPLKPVKKIIGQSTEECIASGLFFGNIEMIGGLVRMIKKTTRGGIFVVGTGGWGAVLVRHIKEINEYEPNLVFLGMKELKNHAKNT